MNFGIHGIIRYRLWRPSEESQVFHIKSFAWQKGIQLTDWYFTRGHTWRNYAGLEASVDDDPIQGYTELPGIHFSLSTVIWFGSYKTSTLSWCYIKAKYSHALHKYLAHKAVSFYGSFHKMASSRTALSNYCFILSFMLCLYLLNGFLCGQKLCKVIHIIADLAQIRQQQNVDNIKSAR